ncbi:type III secretion system export apparatus subunit SctU [Serratia rubidaea]|uniref:Yop proteins translocation protein U n=1 Tax=Serratia rubidaea TaxID=61652 RepID=A0A448SC89_SERRU|nr:type III secretion system export apparatus subunit SctU [Serratia rubidaea]AML56933.1 Type III secretion inner membrane protein (YscU,SpaS,EscU,HrcU,SsaU) [Serratia rubidaea]MEB7586454.1 type III secretion system export apparatus subunit SctU [Serratia rubidaea]VEI65345.1 Yop proteins translocation protein U [Serratia rubidaea]
MSEKTEQATPQKLQESRKKGQVGQSQDIPKLLISIGILEAIFALVEDGMQRMESMMLLPLLRLRDPFGHAMEEVLSDSLLVLALFSAIVCSIALLLRVLGGWIQFGPLFSVEALLPKPESLNPVNHFKNMFSGRQMAQLLTSIIKAAAIGVVLWLSLAPEMGNLARLAQSTLDGFWHGVLQLFISCARRVLLVLLALSLMDFGVQRFFFLKQQRMSHEDIRNEYKQNEGDPHMKGHRRQVAQDILNEEPSAARNVAVEEADVLLVNPTHYAVGLYYRPGETPLPRLVFKAHGDDAHYLVDQAQRAHIPVVRYIWLTRTLYRTTPEGSWIPRETLKAVAQVYRLLRELEDSYLNEVIELEEEPFP